jgi:hypothetical protein
VPYPVDPLEARQIQKYIPSLTAEKPQTYREILDDVLQRILDCWWRQPKWQEFGFFMSGNVYAMKKSHSCGILHICDVLKNPLSFLLLTRMVKLNQPRVRIRLKLIFYRYLENMDTRSSGKVRSNYLRLSLPAEGLNTLGGAISFWSHVGLVGE